MASPMESPQDVDLLSKLQEGLWEIRVMWQWLQQRLEHQHSGDSADVYGQEAGSGFTERNKPGTSCVQAHGSRSGKGSNMTAEDVSELTVFPAFSLDGVDVEQVRCLTPALIGFVQCMLEAAQYTSTVTTEEVTKLRSLVESFLAKPRHNFQDCVCLNSKQSETISVSQTSSTCKIIESDSKQYRNADRDEKGEETGCHFSTNTGVTDEYPHDAHRRGNSNPGSCYTCGNIPCAMPAANPEVYDRNVGYTQQYSAANCPECEGEGNFAVCTEYSEDSCEACREMKNQNSRNVRICCSTFSRNNQCAAGVTDSYGFDCSNKQSLLEMYGIRDNQTYGFCCCAEQTDTPLLADSKVYENMRGHYIAQQRYRQTCIPITLKNDPSAFNHNVANVLCEKLERHWSSPHQQYPVAQMLQPPPHDALLMLDEHNYQLMHVSEELLVQHHKLLNSITILCRVPAKSWMSWVDDLLGLVVNGLRISSGFLTQCWEITAMITSENANLKNRSQCQTDEKFIENADCVGDSLTHGTVANTALPATDGLLYSNGHQQLPLLNKANRRERRTERHCESKNGNFKANEGNYRKVHGNGDQNEGFMGKNSSMIRLNPANVYEKIEPHYYETNEHAADFKTFKASTGKYFKQATNFVVVHHLGYLYALALNKVHEIGENLARVKSDLDKQNKSDAKQLTRNDISKSQKCTDRKLENCTTEPLIHANVKQVPKKEKKSATVKQPIRKPQNELPKKPATQSVNLNIERKKVAKNMPESKKSVKATLGQKKLPKEALPKSAASPPVQKLSRQDEKYRKRVKNYKKNSHNNKNMQTVETKHDIKKRLSRKNNRSAYQHDIKHKIEQVGGYMLYTQSTCTDNTDFKTEVPLPRSAKRTNASSDQSQSCNKPTAFLLSPEPISCTECEKVIRESQTTAALEINHYSNNVAECSGIEELGTTVAQSSVSLISKTSDFGSNSSAYNADDSKSGVTATQDEDGSLCSSNMEEFMAEHTSQSKAGDVLHSTIETPQNESLAAVDNSNVTCSAVVTSDVCTCSTSLSAIGDCSSDETEPTLSPFCDVRFPPRNWLKLKEEAVALQTEWLQLTPELLEARFLGMMEQVMSPSSVAEVRRILVCLLTSIGGCLRQVVREITVHHASWGSVRLLEGQAEGKHARRRTSMIEKTAADGFPKKDIVQEIMTETDEKCGEAQKEDISAKQENQTNVKNVKQEKVEESQNEGIKEVADGVNEIFSGNCVSPKKSFKIHPHEATKEYLKQNSPTNVEESNFFGEPLLLCNVIMDGEEGNALQQQTVTMQKKEEAEPAHQDDANGVTLRDAEQYHSLLAVEGKNQPETRHHENISLSSTIAKMEPWNLSSTKTLCPAVKMSVAPSHEQTMKTAMTHSHEPLPLSHHLQPNAHSKSLPPEGRGLPQYSSASPHSRSQSSEYLHALATADALLASHRSVFLKLLLLTNLDSAAVVPRLIGQLCTTLLTALEQGKLLVASRPALPLLQTNLEISQFIPVDIQGCEKTMEKNGCRPTGTTDESSQHIISGTVGSREYLSCESNKKFPDTNICDSEALQKKTNSSNSIEHSQSWPMNVHSAGHVMCYHHATALVPAHHLGLLLLR